MPYIFWQHILAGTGLFIFGLLQRLVYKMGQPEK
jgi:hypothetical protein